MTVGQRMAFVREEFGMAQIPFAQKLGVSQSAYKNYERGASPAPLKVVLDLCDLCGASLLWIVKGEGEPCRFDPGSQVEAAVVEVEKFLEQEAQDLPIEKKAILVRKAFEDLFAGKEVDRSLLALLVKMGGAQG